MLLKQHPMVDEANVDTSNHVELFNQWVWAWEAQKKLGNENQEWRNMKLLKVEFDKVLI